MNRAPTEGASAQIGAQQLVRGVRHSVTPHVQTIGTTGDSVHPRDLSGTPMPVGAQFIAIDSNKT